MDPSPQPLQTVEQLRASEQKETRKETLSWQQDNSRTRHSACPTAKLKKQATWTNYSMRCPIPQRTCTSYQGLNGILSSASQNLQTPTTLQFSTRMKSKSTMPTKQQLSSLGAQFSEDGDANKQTYGEFPS